MKKIFSLILVLVMIVSTTACRSSADSTETQSATAAGTTQAAETKAEAEPQTEAAAESENSAGALENPERYGGVLNVAYTLNLGKTLDPLHTTGWKMYIWTNYVFENILTRSADGMPQPGVCDFESSDDQLTLKLWVREGKKFHNGDAVTIDDVVASIDRFLYSTLRKNFNDEIESVEVNDGVATYKFKEFNLLTMEYFTRNQTWAVVMPKSICEKYGENPVTDVADCIGTGPYKVTEFTPEVMVGMEKFEDYIPMPNEAGGMADARYGYMDKINVWLNTDSNSSTMALLNGEYDICRIPNEFDETAAGSGMQKFNFYAGVSDLYLAFNTKGNRPVAKDVNLRKAIVAALDMPECVTAEAQASGALDVVIDSCPMGETTQYYYNGFNTEDYIGSANVELAKQYLEAAHYNGEEIILLVNTGSTYKIDVVAESYLRAAGINVTLKYVEGGSFDDFIKNVDDYDMVFLTSAINQFDPATLTASQKSTYWANDHKDELFDQLTQCKVNSEESFKIWDELKQIWIDDCATVMFGYFAEGWTADGDLVLNQDDDAQWTFFVNSYWKNPADHQ